MVWPSALLLPQGGPHRLRGATGYEGRSGRPAVRAGSTAAVTSGSGRSRVPGGPWRPPAPLELSGGSAEGQPAPPMAGDWLLGATAPGGHGIERADSAALTGAESPGGPRGHPRRRLSAYAVDGPTPSPTTAGHVADRPDAPQGDFRGDPRRRPNDATDRHFVGRCAVTGPPDCLPVDLGSDGTVPSGRSHRIGYHPVDELPTEGPRIERRINLATRRRRLSPPGDRQLRLQTRNRHRCEGLRGNAAGARLRRSGLPDRGSSLERRPPGNPGSGERQPVGIVRPEDAGLVPDPRLLTTRGLGDEPMLILHVQDDALVDGAGTALHRKDPVDDRPAAVLL